MYLRLDVQRKIDEFSQKAHVQEKGSTHEMHQVLNEGVCHYANQYDFFLRVLYDYEEDYPCLKEMTPQERKLVWTYDYLVEILDDIEEYGTRAFRVNLDFLKAVDSLEEPEHKYHLGLNDLKLLWVNEVYGKNQAFLIYSQLSGEFFEMEELERKYMLSILWFMHHLSDRYDYTGYLTRINIYTLLYFHGLELLVRSERKGGLHLVMENLKHMSDDFCQSKYQRRGFVQKPQLVRS